VMAADREALPRWMMCPIGSEVSSSAGLSGVGNRPRPIVIELAKQV
jgi:hypothetical protein